MKLRDHFQIFRRAAKFTFSTNRKYTVSYPNTFLTISNIMKPEKIYVFTVWEIFSEIPI